MKKVLLGICLLLIASPAWATYTVGNHTSAVSTSGAAVTTSGIDTTGARAVLFQINADSDVSCSTITPHDNKNPDGAWRLVATKAAPSGVKIHLWEIAGADIVFGTGHTFTTSAGTCYESLYVLALNSDSTTSGFNSDQSASSATSALTISAGSITPTENNEIIISSLGFAIDPGDVSSIGSGFTIIESRAQTANSYGGALAYKIQTTAAAVNPLWTLTNSGNVAAINVSLKDQFPVCAGSSPNLSAATWDDVAACHNIATDGDTITVSSGSFTVTTTTTITKHVRIIPSGVVTLTDNVCDGSCGSGASDSMIALLGSADGSQRFGAVGSGFVIDQGTSLHGSPSAVVYMASSTTPPIVAGNTYNKTQGGAGIFIEVQGHMGVIHGNTMNSFPAGDNCSNTDFFVQLNGNGSGWTEISKFGNADTDGYYKVYIENNTINYAQEGVSTNSGSRSVIRFNTFRNAGIDHHRPDTQVFGGRYEEVYNNNFVSDDRTDWMTCGDTPVQNAGSGLSLGGGTTFFLNNTVDDTAPLIASAWGHRYGFELWEVRPAKSEFSTDWRCWGTDMNPFMYSGFPIPYQNGWGYISGGTQAGNAPVYMDREPIYIANNTGTSPDYSTITVGNHTSNECGTTESPSDYVHANQEYYAQLDLGDFDGTVGASQGTRSERPATCTAGVAYWSTDVGEWDSTHAGNDGVLDLCTSTNVWNAGNDSIPFYTPYDYPHPLAGVGPPAHPNGGFGRFRGR